MRITAQQPQLQDGLRALGGYVVPHTATDNTVYDLVIADLASDPSFHPWIRSLQPEGFGPRILDETARVDADILEWACDAPEQVDIPDVFAVCAALLARNTAILSLDHYQPGSGARLVSRDRLCRMFSARRSRGGVSDRCIIRFAAPGYDARRTTACAFFWFEDGSECGGGAGVYWLKRVGNTWVIFARSIKHHRVTRTPMLGSRSLNACQSLRAG